MTAHSVFPNTDNEAPITGRRHSPRLRLAIPARFRSVYHVQECILLDISRTGACFALSTPLAVGSAGFIEIGRFELFGDVTRHRRNSGDGVNALHFDPQISQAIVLEVRAMAEAYPQRERALLRDEAQRWATGRG
jgi:hypothetical protein